MIIVVCGVSGSGKSTIGRMLAERLRCEFFDADDFHPAANVEKMRSGTPLSDEDREPWLDELSRLLSEHVQSEEGAVLACSALRESYRRKLGIDQMAIKSVFLEGDKSMIASRLEARDHEFMPAALLDSQFSTLERPRDGIIVSIACDPESVCERIMLELRGAI